MIVERLGVTVRQAGPGADPAQLVGLALRRNPKRAHLLVSRVLGKHIPTDPRQVRDAGLQLGGMVQAALADEKPVVLGFAETATALGHCVAEGLGGVRYLHSTRRDGTGVVPFGGFVEEHSHATEHLMLPRDPGWLLDGSPLVLVDDELSTGRTALNTIMALHRIAPRERYVVAALVDVRPPDSPLQAGVEALGARLDVVALARGEVHLPPDILDRAAAIRADLRDDAKRRADRRGRSGRVGLRELGWPASLPVGGRHGFGPDDHIALDGMLPSLATDLVRHTGIERGERVLVLGTEELMQLPLRLAQTMADAGHDVRFSTTTRSPAVVADDPGYALRSGITFRSPEDGGERFAYNVHQEKWDHVLVVVDPPADTPALPAALAPYRTTVVVTP